MKRVAIAGASSGIGAACARLYAAQGAELILCARTAFAGPPDARVVLADLATDAGAEAFAAQAGAVDLALICVGSAHRAVALDQASRETLLGQFVQNAVAPALAAGALLRRGAKSVLFLSSMATRRPPMPGAGPYTASKAALEALVRAFAEENWPRARVNALCLGPVRTRLHEQAGTPAEWVQQFPTPDEAAPAVLLAAVQPGSGQLFGDDLLADAEVLPEPEQEGEPGRRPSPHVRRKLRESADQLHRYPRGAGELAARLASLHGVSADCVALSGGGATELLERCLRALCSPGEEIVSPFPTFEVLSALCVREGVRHRPVPLRRTPDGLFEARHDPQALLHALGPRTRLLYVASPDNPTGAVLDQLFEAPVPVLLDEAWSLELPKPLPAAPGLVRLRSLSKLHGLAALRVGYALGPPELIVRLRKLELPFPLGAPQLAAANAVLDEPERHRRAALLLVRERARVAQALRALGCAVSESEAPVLLLRGGSPGRLAYALRAAGLPVHEAHFDPSAAVVALGRPAQNNRLVDAARRAFTS